MIGTLGLLLLVALLGLVLHLLVVRPLHRVVRRVVWTLSGAVERDVPAEPVTEEHPRFGARLTAGPVEGEAHGHRFALGGAGRVLVARESADAFGVWDPATARRTGRLPVGRGTHGLAKAVAPDGQLFADLAGARCHLARIHPLAGGEPVDVPVRHRSPVLDAWLTDGDGGPPCGCEEEVVALGVAATTERGERPLVVVTALQSFDGGVADGEFGPGAILVRTYDVARPGAPLVAEVLHPTPPRDGPHDRAAVLSPDTRLVAVGAADATADDVVEVVDRVTGRVVCRLDDEPGGAYASSADGDLLVCALRRRAAERGLIVTTCTVSVWELPAGRRRARWVTPRSGVRCAAVTGGPGGLVAVGAESAEEVCHHSRQGVRTVQRHRSSVAVHRLDDGALLHDLPVRADQLAVAAGGRLVAAGTGGLTLWDVGTP